MSDSRTTRLAHPDQTPERVQQFINYQRTLLKALLETSGDDWAGRFAFGHAKALKECGLEPQELRRVAAAVESFCGRRWSAKQVADRIAEAKARVESANKRGVEAPAREASIVANTPKELAKLEDLTELEAVLGTVTLASLKAREVELLELHRAVASAEGRGHVHFKGLS
jgi:hypothetical protein